jgi:hypothetical protein
MACLDILPRAVENLFVNREPQIHLPPPWSFSAEKKILHVLSPEESAWRLISHVIRKRIDGLNPDTCKLGDDDSFFVADLGQVFRQHLLWHRTLPGIKPFFGIIQYSISPTEEQ